MNNLKTIWIYIFFLKIQQIDINYILPSAFVLCCRNLKLISDFNHQSFKYKMDTFYQISIKKRGYTISLTSLSFIHAESSNPISEYVRKGELKGLFA